MRDIVPYARRDSVLVGILYSFATARKDLTRPILVSERANKILPSWLADFCEDSMRIGGIVGG
jgi:hypothetical protein